MTRSSVEVFIPLEEVNEVNEEISALIREQSAFISDLVRRVEFREGGVALTLSRPAEDLVGLKSDIRDLVTATLASFKKVREKTLVEYDGEVLPFEDPYPQLAATRQVVLTAPGVYLFQGNFLSSMISLDGIFKRNALGMGSVEQHCPATVPYSSLLSNGYVDSFPHHVLMVAALQRNVSAGNRPGHPVDHRVDPPGALGGGTESGRQMLSPTVCYHCFEGLRGQRVGREGATFTAIATCHRNEGRLAESLERLQTFTMREVVFFGSKEFVENRRRGLMEHCTEVMTTWGMKFRVVTASDPFFATGAERRRAFQSALELKYELQLYLPYREAWLSVASFNNHQQKLVAAYDIGFDSEAPLYSGCVGYGYERLALGLHAQKGPDRRRWPQSLQGEQRDAERD